MDAVTRAGEIIRTSGMLDRIKNDGYARVDPFLVAARFDLPVMLRPLDKLLGAYVGGDAPGVLINSARPPGQVHMTCAHELGHHFLGHPTTTDEEVAYEREAQSIEQEADTFAYHLLAPRQLIARIAKGKRWSASDLSVPMVIYQLSLRLGVSYRAMVWTLRSQEIFDYSTAADLAAVAPARLKRALLPSVRAEGDDDSAFTKDVWLLDKADAQFILEPRAGDRFLIDLPNHLSSGYEWTVDQAREEGFTLEPLLESTTPSSTVGSEEPFVAGGGSVRYTVKASTPLADDRPESLPLDFIETRPWQRATAPRDRFETVAQFEVLLQGLDDRTKQAMLAGVEPP